MGLVAIGVVILGPLSAYLLRVKGEAERRAHDLEKAAEYVESSAENWWVNVDREIGAHRLRPLAELADGVGSDLLKAPNRSTEEFRYALKMLARAEELRKIDGGGVLHS